MEETFTEAFTTAINSMLSLIEREHQATIKALEESHKKHIKLLCDAHEQIDQMNDDYKARLNQLINILMSKIKNKNHEEEDDLRVYPKKWIKNEENNDNGG